MFLDKFYLNSIYVLALQSQRSLVILVGLTMTWYSELRIFFGVLDRYIFSQSSQRRDPDPNFQQLKRTNWREKKFCWGSNSQTYKQMDQHFENLHFALRTQPILVFVETCRGYSFWDRLRNFFHTFTWTFLSVDKLNKLGKFW